MAHSPALRSPFSMPCLQRRAATATLRSMILLDRSLPSPAENLALDEALLRQLDDELIAGRPGTESLRLWEMPNPCLVLGATSRWREEVHEEASRAADLPILRRDSGGAAVVLGPGCLCFSLVLSLDRRPAWQDIRRSYEDIGETHARALDLETAGPSDLAIAETKVSGNAQRRLRRSLLHHGTLLYDFDLTLIERVLRPPPRQPEYRRERPHREFLRLLPQDGATLRRALAQAWRAKPRPLALPVLDKLIEERYDNPTWTYRR